MDEIESIFGVALGGGDGGHAPSSREVNTAGSKVTYPEPSSDETSGVVPTTEPMKRLAQFVMNAFIVNVDHRGRSGIDDKLRDAILAQTCQYNESQREKLKKAGINPNVYTPITSTKIRAAKAMLVDIFQSSGEWPFTLAPTPDPDVADSVMEEAMISVEMDLQATFNQLEQMGIDALPEPVMALLQRRVTDVMGARYDEIFHKKEKWAKIRASRMEKKVQDIMAEGGWVDAFNEYVDNICTYGTGIILGPIPRVVAKNRCVENHRTGARKYVREYHLIPTYEAVSPVDCYPAPDAKNIDDGPLCIRVRYNPNELRAFADANANKESVSGVEGWNVATMRALLGRYPNGGCKINYERRDPTIRAAENNATDDPRDCTMEGIRCFASVRGSDLIDFGITKTRDRKKIERDVYYATETIMFDNYIVYCRIIDDRLGRPVSKGVFYEIPGSWWGESVAAKCCMVQSVMNNCIKALLQNMAVASGPMMYITDVSRMVDKSPNGLKFSPHKIIPFTGSMMGNSGAPMGVLQAPSNASELLAVFDKMRVQADDDSGIPAYTYGQSSGQGALRTASGLAIFSEAASRGMKMVIGTTDRLVTRDQVKKTCNWILLYGDDINIKGDCEVMPAGVMGKILKAQQDQQRLQFLNMAISNQMLQQIFGVKGIVALLRPSIQDLAINPDDCLPSESELEDLAIIQKIQQVFQATQATQAVTQAGQEAAGAPSGVAQPEKPESVQSGVEQRRSAA